jgi:hypothetical protein
MPLQFSPVRTGGASSWIPLNRNRRSRLSGLPAPTHRDQALDDGNDWMDSPSRSEFSTDEGEAALNPFEDQNVEHVRQMRRLETQRQRTLVAEDILEESRVTRKRTRAVTRIKTILEPHKTNEELLDRLNADYNMGLGFVPVVSPDTAQMNKELGLPQSLKDEPCYGCEIGLHAQGVGSDLIMQTRRAILHLYSSTPNRSLRYKLISRYWEVHVKRPANRNLTTGEEQVKSWTPRMVRIHFERHAGEPSFKRDQMLSHWEEIYDVVWQNQIFFVSSQFARSGERPTAADMHVASAGIETLRKVTEMRCKLMGLDPKKVPGYQTEFNITNSVMGALANQVSDMVVETDINPVLKEREDWRY